MKHEEGRMSLLQHEVGPVAGAGGEQSMLQDYSADFTRLRTVASSKVAALKGAAGSATWAEDVRAAERALEAMESNRKQVSVQLKLELGGSGGGQRQEWDKRLQEWAREVAGFRGELEAARETHSRRALQLDGRAVVGGGISEASRANRQSASLSTASLERSTIKLEEAARQALETEAISEGVMGDLSQQRDVISNVKKNMRTIGAELTSARQSLNRMLQFAAQNNLITVIIGAVLGVALMFLVLCFFGFPLKYTAILAVVLSALVGLTISIRRRLKARRAAVALTQEAVP